MSVSAKSDNNSRSLGSEEANRLVNGEEEILRSADQELHSIGEELLEAEKMQERILRDREKKPRKEEAEEMAKNEKEEEKDLKEALNDLKKSKNELDDLIHKIESDKELMVFLGYASHFDSAPSHKSLNKIEEAINNISDKNKKLGKSDLERIGKEAKEIQEEIEDARKNLKESADFIEDAAGYAKAHAYKDYDEEHDKILVEQYKLLEEVAERIRKLNRPASSSIKDMQKVPLSILEQDTRWVSKIVRKAESGF